MSKNIKIVLIIFKKDNPEYYDLVKEFGKISGTYGLLNTSFNILGNPILTTIKDALYVLDNTKLDYVIVDGYLFGENNE